MLVLNMLTSIADSKSTFQITMNLFFDSMDDLILKSESFPNDS